ncbi:MAG: glycosyltransferase family 2 protein [Syntrophobacteraceae bacterium]
MNTEPIENKSDNPLISIVIYNYDGRYLRQSLDSIFNQSVLQNFEVILIDNATCDGSVDVAMEFVSRYHRRITFQRNRKILGPEVNFWLCSRMAKGRYLATLTDDQAFLPEYVKHCVQTMATDPYAKFNMVYHDNDPELPLFTPVSPLFPRISEKPLVSILCYNYNYGRYLRESLESVFSQTYENIELCFSDNASTDDSWDIALEFARNYPDRMYMTRNRKNFGPEANFANCRRVSGGKYFVNFCSDDVLDLEYVERCVNILEANPNAGLALVNRAIIDENGLRTEEPPFYNQSCIIPGEEQAAVYMMAGVNPSVSQIMYRHASVDTRTATGGLLARYYGTRILDFNISLDFDIAYIKDPLLLHRVHSQSDTSQANAALLPVIGLYVLNHQLADIASVRNLTKVEGRLPQSLNKLARLGIRYSVRYLLAKDEQTALRYFHLAAAINPLVENDATWKQLREYWAAEAHRKTRIIEQLLSTVNLAARSISYDPPPGSIEIVDDNHAGATHGSRNKA